MTQNTINEIAELALKHSLFESVEPSLTTAHDETIDFKIPHVFITKFAAMIAAECVKLCEQNGEDVDNGDVFRSEPHRQLAYDRSWGAGSYECAELIKQRFDLKGNNT